MKHGKFNLIEIYSLTTYDSPYILVLYFKTTREPPSSGLFCSSFSYKSPNLVLLKFLDVF